MTDDIKNKEELEEDEELDFSPFFEYLKTERGHEVAVRVLDFMDAIKQSSLLQSGKISRLELLLQFLLVIASVFAVSYLTIEDKFTPSLGVLFGSLIGYIFGKKK